MMQQEIEDYYQNVLIAMKNDLKGVNQKIDETTAMYIEKSEKGE